MPAASKMSSSNKLQQTKTCSTTCSQFWRGDANILIFKFECMILHWQCPLDSSHLRKRMKFFLMMPNKLANFSPKESLTSWFSLILSFYWSKPFSSPDIHYGRITPIIQSVWALMGPKTCRWWDDALRQYDPENHSRGAPHTAVRESEKARYTDRTRAQESSARALVEQRPHES